MKNFNWIDRIIEKMRFRKVIRYIPKSCILLDFGCGDDYNLIRYLKKHIRMGIGIETKIKNDVHNGNLSIYNDIAKVKNNSVDVITSLAVLEHLNAPLKILIELNRVLKEGGRIIITTPSPLSKPILEFLAFNLKIISEEEIRDHKHYFNKKELRSIFKKAGFKGIKIKSFQFGLNNRLIARKGKNK